MYKVIFYIIFSISLLSCIICNENKYTCHRIIPFSPNPFNDYDNPSFVDINYIEWNEIDITSEREDSLFGVFYRNNAESNNVILHPDEENNIMGIRSNLYKYVPWEGSVVIIEKFYIEDGYENWLWLKKGDPDKPIIYLKYSHDLDIEWD